MGAAGKDRAPRIGQPPWIGRCCARAGAAAKPPLKPANPGASRPGADPASAEGGLAFGRRLGGGGRPVGAVFSAAEGGAVRGRGGDSIRGAGGRRGHVGRGAAARGRGPSLHPRQAGGRAVSAGSGGGTCRLQDPVRVLPLRSGRVLRGGRVPAAPLQAGCAMTVQGGRI